MMPNESNNTNPLVSLAETLKRIAQQLPPPPWAVQNPNGHLPLAKGVEEPPAPEPEEEPEEKEDTGGHRLIYE